MLWTFGAIIVLILISGFFSGSETAVTGASRPRVVQLEKQGIVGQAFCLGFGRSQIP